MMWYLTLPSGLPIGGPYTDEQKQAIETQQPKGSGTKWVRAENLYG